MREFDYKQRPATDEYRSNWDRIFGELTPAPFRLRLSEAESQFIETRQLDAKEIAPFFRVKPEETITRLIGPSGFCTADYFSSTCPWCRGAGCDIAVCEAPGDAR
jgi:hypothetical protein